MSDAGARGKANIQCIEEPGDQARNWKLLFTIQFVCLNFCMKTLNLTAKPNNVFNSFAIMFSKKKNYNNYREEFFINILNGVIPSSLPLALYNVMHIVHEYRIQDGQPK